MYIHFNATLDRHFSVSHRHFQSSVYQQHLPSQDVCLAHESSMLLQSSICRLPCLRVLGPSEYRSGLVPQSLSSLWRSSSERRIWPSPRTSGTLLNLRITPAYRFDPQSKLLKQMSMCLSVDCVHRAPTLPQACTSICLGSVHLRSGSL